MLNCHECVCVCVCARVWFAGNAQNQKQYARRQAITLPMLFHHRQQKNDCQLSIVKHPPRDQPQTLAV